MTSYRTPAIILRRTDYGEADRILQLLTPDHGKVGVLARGVRREKSRLAGGIELFAVSDVSIRQGRGELGSLTGARLEVYYSHIIEDYDRMQLGYEAIKLINRATETVSEPAFFDLLKSTYQALDRSTIAVELTEIWFRLQLGILLGLGLNLTSDTAGQRLQATDNYDFDDNEMAFSPRPGGKFRADHIKFLRLLSARPVEVAAQVQGVDGLLADCLWLSRRIGSH